MAEDEIADSWEELEDSGELDKRIQKLATQSITSDKAPSSRGSGTVLEEGDRSNYQPQVRILKREPVSACPGSGGTQPRNINQPKKTLAEREAAYAQARLRILGSSKNSSEEEEDTSANMTRPVKLTQQFEGIKVSENVVRQPKGPNGSRGFNSSSSNPT